MKPYKYKRGDEGYCCEWDDGPINAFKKKNRRSKKRADKDLARKVMADELPKVGKKVKV